MNQSSSTMNTATSDLQVLRNAMLFSLTTHRFSNRRSADRALVQTTGDKRKINVTKALLVSPDLDKINDLLNETYSWCFERAMQSSAVRRGIYFVKRTMVGEFEAKLAAANAKLNGPDGLVAKFLATYETYKERMKLPAAPASPKAGDRVTVAEGLTTFSGMVVSSREDGKFVVSFDGGFYPSRDVYTASEFIGGLGNLYKESDYPTVKQLSGMFSLEHAWLALSVPDDLPDEVRARESKKLRESFEAASEDIRYALRAGFKEMVDHAIGALTGTGANGKPKIFRDSLVSNFREFFDTFNARNLMEDAELEALVNQAKAVVNGLPRDASEAADSLRSSPDIRTTVAAQFSALNAQLDTLVIEKPIRRFDLEA